ncbi:valine--tRNA ligase [Candidatus Stoquefichus sp. SB1]|jgi:valyl-tRNA synthetase|uniref:valine--tRNA ligase n=1 Tax=Candidatus Stoquefichus sp. SB1 TaxID=1658109 RepID=UPI00067E7209|nr:valine--tRNA ligase [Candidatus Stoquefichus sp. SB1]
MKELASKYNHQKVEAGKYKTWIEKKYFEAGDITKKPYSIVIPPPNVTGKLHLGHAWDTTLQDMIIRYKRMQGYDALWLPGMDHAGIATQAKVEARLREEGISRYDLGREKFLEKAWSWKEEYASIIRSQWEKLGLSLDYSKERFTLDDGLSEAVKTVFVALYEKGLIYQGERIINWDPVQRTALSNIEVIHKEIEGHMYYFKYEVVETNETLVIATTRPETMFADQAIFVHPDDERYTHLVGKHAINPANGDPLPIMADSYIDMSFGTAVMKCTPAHDPNDFALAKKYHLAMPICMNDDGTMNDLCGKYVGMDRFECREALVADFQTAGVVDHIETHMHQVGHSERSHAIVEPYLSKQWFVKMKPLAQAALENQNQDSKVHFVPGRFEKTFQQWMENIEDWCISRQLWWGHQVPAWYHKETGEVYVGKEAPADLENWKQDEDVLDTWFSSALWPFSTMGWPDTENELLKRYFPTNTLVTGYDIIFFWVSRMIFQSLEFTGERPFENVLIHGLIRDEQGRKMSKSLGNGVDPMDVIDEYGADTLRFFLTTNSAPGMDLRYVPEKLEASWNFINKIWNSARFVLMNIDEDMQYADLSFEHLNLSDQWILKRLNDVIVSVDDNMDKFEFVNVGSELYSFIWDDFCSWYIELSKVHLNSDDAIEKTATQNTLVYVLNAIVRLLHPFMPFVTEEIYQSIPHLEESICISAWPTVREEFESSSINDQFQYLFDIIKGIRNMRAQYVIKNAIEIAYSIQTNDEALETLLQDLAPYIYKLCHAQCIGYNVESSANVATEMIKGGNALIIELGDYIDLSAEKQKLEDELKKLTSEIKRCEGMLSNPNFVNKAPAAKVEAEKTKLADYQSKYNAVKEKIEKM